MLGLRGWPNITAVESTVPGMIRLIEETSDEMASRYGAVESAQAENASFRRRMLIVDGVLALAALVGDHWAKSRAAGQPVRHPVMAEFGPLAAMGQGCLIHVLLAGDGADAIPDFRR